MPRQTVDDLRPRRSRQDIVKANDRAILEAVLQATTDTGWDAVTFTNVAKRAGLTVGAIYNRAESKEELGIAVWSEAVRDWLAAGLTEIVAAAHAGDEQRLQRAFIAMEAEGLIATAAIEFLIAALFDEDLGEVVGADATRILTSVISEGRAAHEQAAAVLVLAVAFGRLIALRGSVDLEPMTAQDARILSGYFGVPADDALPDDPTVSVRFLRADPIDDLDEDTDEICSAVIEVISRVGYRRATIARMGRAAGRTGSRLIQRYRDKAHLVAYAVLQKLVTPEELWSNFQEAEAAYGPRVSRALWVRDVMRPENVRFWALHLELARVSEYVEELQDFRVSPARHGQVNLGVMMVASYAGDVADLPYAGPFSAGFVTASH